MRKAMGSGGQLGEEGELRGAEVGGLGQAGQGPH